MNNIDRDIKIKKDNEQFKFRVAGIIEKDNKILIARMDYNEYFCFPGGHVEMLENTKHAIERELNEELYFKIKTKDLFAIHENFYRNKNKDFHEICFYYLAEPKEEINLIDKYYEEIDHGSLVKYEYKWIDKKDLRNYNLHPKFIVEKIINNNKNFEHFISKD